MHRIRDVGGEFVLSSQFCSVIGTTAAIIGAAVIGAGASAVAASSSNKAIGNAADATQKAADTATAEQKRQFDISQANQQPWLTTGKGALDKLSGMYGIGPEAGAVDPNADFYKSPDYQFRFNEGIKGLDASAAAGGTLDSGATRKAAIEFSGNLAAGEFTSYANRLAALAGVGQTAANTLGSQGSIYAKNVGDIAMDQGNNKASSYLAKSQNYGNTIQGLAGVGSGLIMNNPGWFGGGSTPPQQPAPYNMNWG